MRAWAFGLFGLWLFGISAALSQDAVTHKRMQIERSADVCSALSPAECCAQMLEIALFRATGDQVPRLAKTPLRLSCKDASRTIPENACRLIAMGRGFDAREAAQLCAPGGLAKRCADDTACKQCVTDLDRLEWKAPARACYALTYVSKPDAADSARTRRWVSR
jgi:hypothetical protein